MTHICVGKLIIIGSDNGLSPDRRQAIIWTNDGLLLIGLIGTNFSEILIKILTSSFKKMRLKVSSAKRRPFCLGLNVLSVLLCNPILGILNIVSPNPIHNVLMTKVSQGNSFIMDHMHVRRVTVVRLICLWKGKEMYAHNHGYAHKCDI